jgi:hypothetical protein
MSHKKNYIMINSRRFLEHRSWTKKRVLAETCYQILRAYGYTDLKEIVNVLYINELGAVEFHYLPRVLLEADTSI